jgi:riboflavin kinase/FMN adenylyltransferase
MKILRHAQPPGRPSAIAIGSFDGVHLGHAAILARVAAEAEARDLDPAVLTFEPLPREFFSPESAPARLTSLAERLTEIARHGIRTAFLERFDAAFAALTPDAFCVRLRQNYGARWVMVGPDFRFGARRAGDHAFSRRPAAAWDSRWWCCRKSWRARPGSRARACAKRWRAPISPKPGASSEGRMRSPGA